MSVADLTSLLRLDGVREECELGSTFGFMAFHGGGLEAATDVVARLAATAAGASYYAVIHPEDPPHLPSTRFDPAQSPTMASFLEHVDVVVTIHGFGRRGLFSSLLLGGRNRALAGHVADHLRPRLPAYRLVCDIDEIPSDLRGLHPRNPVNLPRSSGVQIELPPRVRGSSPLWWDWERGLTPHTEALIEGLAAAARSWPTATRADV
ncbi:MAG: hypothetical protein RIR49_145 [Actinomycetota bacterium]